MKKGSSDEEIIEEMKDAPENNKSEFQMNKEM